MRIVILTISIMIFIGTIAYYAVSSITFNKNCGGYLELAANANSIDLAKSNLDKAIQYLEKNQLTTGYTSIVYNTPDENVTYWYANLKACQRELDVFSVRPGSTLEETNFLMKLRESLTTPASEGGQHIITPQGISIFPCNTQLLLMLLMGLFGICVSTIYCIFIHNKEYGYN